MRRAFLDTDDGARLQLRLAGARGHTPVLMLHSLFFDGSMFGPVISRMPPDHLYLAPDHRGQGQSTPGTARPTAERLAADMLSLCDAHGVGPVHVVGSSMGGYVAIEMLAADPARIASLTLSCCTCQREPDPGRFDALADRIAAADGHGLADTLMPLMFGEPFLADPTRAETRDRWRARFDILPPGTDRVVRGIFAHRGWRKLLRVWGGPILALAGDADRAKSPADLAWIETEGLGRFHLFARAGHTPPVEDPVGYAAVLSDFLATVEPRTPNQRKTS